MAQELGIHVHANRVSADGQPLFNDNEQIVRRRLWFGCVKIDRYGVHQSTAYNFEGSFCRYLGLYTGRKPFDEATTLVNDLQGARWRFVILNGMQGLRKLRFLTIHSTILTVH